MEDEDARARQASDACERADKNIAERGNELVDELTFDIPHHYHRLRMERAGTEKPVVDRQLFDWNEHNHSEFVPCVPALCEVARERVINGMNKAMSKTGKPTAAEAQSQRVYISGPMRGHHDLNHAQFDSLQDAMEQQGWTVHSPAQTNRTHGHTPETPYSEAIRLDVESLLESDAICLLPGWRQSEGARFEAEIARSLGLDFYESELVQNFTDDVADAFPGDWNWAPFDPAELGVEGIDQEARRIVYGERAATYGHPRGDFDIIAKIWSGILMPVLKEDITAEQVALCMSGLKLGRLSKSPRHHDSQVDVIGYMLCLARLQEDPREIAAWDEHAANFRREQGLADS